MRWRRARGGGAAGWRLRLEPSSGGATSGPGIAKPERGGRAGRLGRRGVAWARWARCGRWRRLRLEPRARCAWRRLRLEPSSGGVAASGRRRGAAAREGRAAGEPHRRFGRRARGGGCALRRVPGAPPAGAWRRRCRRAGNREASAGRPCGAAVPPGNRIGAWARCGRWRRLRLSRVPVVPPPGQESGSRRGAAARAGRAAGESHGRCGRGARGGGWRCHRTGTGRYEKSTPTGQWSEPRVSGQMKASVTRFAALGEAST